MIIFSIGATNVKPGNTVGYTNSAQVQADQSNLFGSQSRDGEQYIAIGLHMATLKPAQKLPGSWITR